MGSARPDVVVRGTPGQPIVNGANRLTEVWRA
jgi:hypothetical protein